MKKVALMLMFALAFQSNAYSYFLDGNTLVAQMREYKMAQQSPAAVNQYPTGDFISFVVAVHDVIQHLGYICDPINVNPGQVGSITIQYLENNPARWAEPAHILVSEALMAAFPCAR